MPDEKPVGKPDLELEVGVGVPVELRQLVTASEIFQTLINEVAREYTGAARAPVRWLVEVQAGSVKLPLRAEPASDEVAASQIREIPRSIADGLAQLEREAVRPEFFNDKALEEAKRLATQAKADFPVAIRNGGERTRLSPQLVANVEKILGRPRKSFGTVEGRLDSLSVHTAREFAVWRTDGTRVPCYFGRFLSLDDVLPAVGKRVAARGEVKTHPRTGEPESIEVHDLRILGEFVVRAQDVRGIFRGRERADD